MPIPVKLRGKYRGGMIAKRKHKAHPGQMYGSMRKKAKRFPGSVPAAKLKAAKLGSKHARKRGRPG